MSNSAGRRIHVLGIESSCDDTGVAIVSQDGTILSNCVHSQLKRHLAHGGIIPVVAREYHLQNIDRIAKQAFELSGLKSVATDVDAIAVSTRPGLKFSLQVGLNYARTLAKKYSKPLIPVHHMQAHALMPTLQSSSKIRFPFIALLLSGGHCILAIAKRFNEFQILGSTKDEAPGDLLDKFARRVRLRNLGPPFDNLSGGAAIELLSKRDGADKFKYFNSDSSIPMLRNNNCDFSFSGYRGSYEMLAPMFDELWRINAKEELMAELGDACASLQRSILIQIVKKIQRAIMFYRMHWRYRNENAFASGLITEHLGFKLHKIDDDVPMDMDEGIPLDLLVSGGVAANGYLIDGIKLACSEIFEQSVKVHAPERSLCSDNGVMVAWNGMLHYKDFLNARHQHREGGGGEPYNKYDSVVCDTVKQIDLVNIEADCPIGMEITNQVEAANFKLDKLTHSEFKLTNKSQSAS